MKSTALLLAALTAAGSTLAAQSQPQPATTCPKGDHAIGQRPPAGHEWQCVDAQGVADGPWLTWYDDGQLMAERHMKQGREHGRQRSWWPNGQLMMEGISYEGHRYKGFKYWSINGEPVDLKLKTETVTQPAVAQPQAGEAK